MQAIRTSKHNRVARGLKAVMGLLVLVCLCLVLAPPNAALADKAGPHPHVGDDGDDGGGGEVGQIIPVCITFDENLAIRSDGLEDGRYCHGGSGKKIEALVGRNFSIVFARREDGTLLDAIAVIQ